MRISTFCILCMFSIPRLRVLDCQNIKNRCCRSTAFSASLQPSPAQSFAPCCHHKDKHTHPLCFPSPSPCPVLLYLWLNVWLQVGINTLQKTGLAQSGEWATWSGCLPDPARCRKADRAHSLSSLKDCSLIRSTPSNLISRLLLSQAVEMHLKWHLLQEKHHWLAEQPASCHYLWLNEQSRTLGFECE